MNGSAQGRRGGASDHRPDIIAQSERQARHASAELSMAVRDATDAGWVVNPCNEADLAHLWSQALGGPRPAGTLVCAGQWTPDFEGERYLWIAREALASPCDPWNLHSLANGVRRLAAARILSLSGPMAMQALPLIPVMRGLDAIANLVASDATVVYGLVWFGGEQVHLAASSDASDAADARDASGAVPLAPTPRFPPSRALAHALLPQGGVAHARATDPARVGRVARRAPAHLEHLERLEEMVRRQFAELGRWLTRPKARSWSGSPITHATHTALPLAAPLVTPPTTLPTPPAPLGATRSSRAS